MADGVAANGASNYTKKCAICQGATGDGKGAGIKRLETLPAAWDARRWAKTTDVDKIKATKCGGVAIGMSEDMPDYPNYTDQQIWDLLELAPEIRVKGRDGKIHDGGPMWTFWSLQEGTLGVDPKLQRTNDGRMPPVIHVDTDAPLFSDVDGSLITDKLWGIYYKPDFNFGGIQGGAMPFKVPTAPEKVKIDPYGPESPDFIVGDDFARIWVSALAFCQKRFEGTMGKYKKEPSGGIGSFTADSFPVFDRFCQNVYVVADTPVYFIGSIQMSLLHKETTWTSFLTRRGCRF